ncbi:MAG: hypothetical protein P4L51_24415 [Puia sp.]|nr:hypothetical protein [Puia sp.]
MRYLLSFLLLCGSVAGMAQDLDFPDFRSKKDNFSKVRDMPLRNDLASFLLAGVDESIGKAVLKNLPVKEYGNNFMTFEGDNIQVTIRTGAFDPSKYKIQRQETHVLKINGHPYYGGNYGELPRTIVQSVTVLIGKDTVAIPKEAYSDLFEPRFSYNESGSAKTRNNVYLSGDKSRIYIYMFNPDFGGSEYTWVIQDKNYLRRVVDFGILQK